MTQEKIYLLGTTEDQLADLIASKLNEALQSFRPASIVDEKKPLSIDDAAEFTGLAKQTIYKATSEGTIPFHKQGGKLWFFRDELIAWIKNEGPASRNKIHLR